MATRELSIIHQSVVWVHVIGMRKVRHRDRHVGAIGGGGGHDVLLRWVRPLVLATQRGSLPLVTDALAGTYMRRERLHADRHW